MGRMAGIHKLHPPPPQRLVTQRFNVFAINKDVASAVDDRKRTCVRANRPHFVRADSPEPIAHHPVPGTPVGAAKGAQDAGFHVPAAADKTFGIAAYFAGRQIAFPRKRHRRRRKESLLDHVRTRIDRRRPEDHQRPNATVACEQFKANMAAERPAYDVNLPQTELIENFSEDAGIAGKAVGSGRADRICRSAVTWKVGRHDAEASPRKHSYLAYKNFLG